jgi:hypothetical protein
MRGRPFEPGNKVGRGRPRGSRNKTSTRVQELLNEYAEPITKKAIAEALKGNPKMMHCLLDRIAPVRRGMPVELGPLSVETVGEVSKASATVLRKVASGKLTISEGGEFLNLLEKQRETLESVEVEQRVQSLESRS